VVADGLVGGNELSVDVGEVGPGGLDVEEHGAATQKRFVVAAHVAGKTFQQLAKQLGFTAGPFEKRLGPHQFTLAIL
jgi:hypothetical protein